MENVNVSIDAGQNLTSLIEKLASKIGTTADQVFPWFVQQQVIEGWFFVIFVSLFLVIGLLLIAFSIKKVDFDVGNRYTAGFIFGAAITVIAVLVMSIGMKEAVSQIMNPNFHALKCLIKHLALLKLA